MCAQFRCTRPKKFASNEVALKFVIGVDSISLLALNKEIHIGAFFFVGQSFELSTTVLNFPSTLGLIKKTHTNKTTTSGHKDITSEVKNKLPQDETVST